MDVSATSSRVEVKQPERSKLRTDSIRVQHPRERDDKRFCIQKRDQRSEQCVDGHGKSLSTWLFLVSIFRAYPVGVHVIIL